MVIESSDTVRNKTKQIKNMFSSKVFRTPASTAVQGDGDDAHRQQQQQGQAQGQKRVKKESESSSNASTAQLIKVDEDFAVFPAIFFPRLIFILTQARRGTVSAVFDEISRRLFLGTFDRVFCAECNSVIHLSNRQCLFMLASICTYTRGKQIISLGPGHLTNPKSLTC